MGNVWATHPELFHYTRIEALEKILESNTLWATNSNHLNDESEAQVFSNELCDHIARHIQRMDSLPEAVRSDETKREAYAVQLAEIVRSTCCEAAWHKGIYITSFASRHDRYAAEHGLLSQWRGYGLGDDGVAIVFDTQKLHRLLQLETSRYDYATGLMDDVIYYSDEEGERDRLAREYKSFFDEVPRFFAAIANVSAKFDYQTFIKGFLSASIRTKHRAFIEEKEVRIAMLPRTEKGQEIERSSEKPLKPTRWRKTMNGQAQYIELFGKEPLPITRVIIGPSRHQVVNEQRVRALVGPDLKVDLSGTPLIGR